MRYLQGLKQRLSKKDFFDFLYMDRRYYGFHVQKTCFYHRKFYLRTSKGHFPARFLLMCLRNPGLFRKAWRLMKKSVHEIPEKSISCTKIRKSPCRASASITGLPRPFLFELQPGLCCLCYQWLVFTLWLSGREGVFRHFVDGE